MILINLFNLNITTMSDTATLVGGWTDFKFEISPDAAQVFEKATENWNGVEYTPMAVATQVVSGTNYCFLCKGVMVVPQQPQIAALVYIHEPNDGKAPFITEIKQIKP